MAADLAHHRMLVVDDDLNIAELVSTALRYVRHDPVRDYPRPTRLRRARRPLHQQRILDRDDPRHFHRRPRRLRSLWAKTGVFGAVARSAHPPGDADSGLLRAGGPHRAQPQRPRHRPLDLRPRRRPRGHRRRALSHPLPTLFALGWGTVLRNTAAGISAFVAVLFVIPPLLDLLPSSWNNTVSPYLPSNAGKAILQLGHPAHILGPGQASDSSPGTPPPRSRSPQCSSSGETSSARRPRPKDDGLVESTLPSTGRRAACRRPQGRRLRTVVEARQPDVRVGTIASQRRRPTHT